MGTTYDPRRDCRQLQCASRAPPHAEARPQAGRVELEILYTRRRQLIDDPDLITGEFLLVPNGQQDTC